MEWIEKLIPYALTALGTGSAIKVVEYYFIARKTRKEGDTQVTLRDKNELQAVREHFVTLAEKLDKALDKLREEKHQVDMKAVVLEYDLKASRQFAVDQETIIINLKAEIEQLKTRNQYVEKMLVINGVVEKENS